MKAREAGLLLAVGLLLVLPLAFRAPAASAGVTGTPAPRVASVDIYIVDVGNLDQSAGSYEADFYLSFAWNGTWYGPDGNQSEALPQNFAILNGEVAKLETVTSDANINGTGENYISYRVYATLYSPMNFARYPLDHQTLSIEVEDNNYDNASMEYVSDGQSQLDPAAHVPGWLLDPGSEKMVVTSDPYKTSFGYPGSPPNSESFYSDATFSFAVHRPFADSAMNVLLPLGVLVALAMVTFKIKPDSFDIRLEVGVISIFTAVAFLLALNSGLPAQDYLTVADQLMIVAFAILIYAVAMAMIIHRYAGSSIPRWAERLNSASFWVAPLVALVAVLILFTS